MWKASLVLTILCGLARSEDNAEAARPRALLLTAPALSSFAGVYDLEQRDATGTVEWAERHEFRFQGSNLYLRRTNLKDANRPPVDIACLNGKFSTMLESPCGFSADLDKGFWPIPWGAFLNPKELFGEFHGKSRVEMLGSGTSRCFEHNGLIVLSHQPEGQAESVEYHIDSNGRVVEIDTVKRPSASREEAEGLWDGDPFDLRRVILTVELRDFVEVNGVYMPSTAVKKWWGHGKTDYVDYREMAVSGVMSWPEAFTNDCKYNTPVAYAVQTFKLYPETAEVNTQLTDLDFSLSIPPGTMLREHPGGDNYVVAAIPDGRVGEAVTRFLAGLGSSKALNNTYATYLAGNAIIVSTEPLPRWVKPAMISAFAASLASLSLLRHIQRRMRKPASL